MSNESDPKSISTLNKEIGRVLKKTRKAKAPRFNQIDLAVATDLQRSYISELENGKRNPTIETLQVICRELNVQMADVIAEAETEYRLSIKRSPEKTPAKTKAKTRAAKTKGKIKAKAKTKSKAQSKTKNSKK